jgi:outer membrane protein
MRPQNLLAFAESEQLVEAARANFEQAEQDMILRVAQAYFNVLIAQESVAMAEAQLRAMEEQGVVASRGYKSGTLSVTDVYEAKSKAELSRAQLLVAKNDLTVKHAELKQLTGRRLERLAELKPVAVIPKPAPDNAEDWVSQAQDNNPLVRAQLFSLRAAGYSVTKAQAGNLWTLDFVASSGSNYSSGNVTMPVGYESRIKSNVMGLQFTMPIFAGGLNQSQTREAVYNKNKLGAQLEEARRKASAEAEQAYAGILSGIAQTEALRAAIESGESSVKGNQSGYKLGIRINSDVLNAQQLLYATRRDLAKARYDTLLQGLKLKAAAGVLSESDIEVINGMLVR